MKLTIYFHTAPNECMRFTFTLQYIFLTSTTPLQQTYLRPHGLTAAGVRSKGNISHTEQDSGRGLVKFNFSLQVSCFVLS